MTGSPSAVRSRFGIIRLFQITTIAAMLALSFVSLTRSCLGTFEFGQMPDNDEALIGWLEKNEPNATVRVYRNPKRHFVIIEQFVPLFAPEPTIPTPPWSQLGYQSSRSASLAFSVIDLYLPWIPILCGSIVLLGLWGIERRQKSRSRQAPADTLEH
ncbi:MAG: hypothetical protein AB8B50_03145 [Pirellulaceae bacterium]